MSVFPASPSRRRAAAAVAAAVLVATATIGVLVATRASPRAAGALPRGAPARATHVCTRFASPTGNDGAKGTRAHAFETIQRLVDALRPGETGCLLSGRFVQDVTMRRGGNAGAPIVLRSAPGDIATLEGRLWIAQSASHVVVTHLHLDGKSASSLPSPTVDGDFVTFSYDDVTNDQMGGLHDGDGICFDIGDATGQYGIAHNTRIAHDRIHDCGTADNHNHGIYVDGSVDAVIADNWIYDNADRGVQLYPDAQGTLVENNVIEGNGEGVIFSGDATHASSDNVVIHNVIVGSRTRHNVEYWWPGPVGTGNRIDDNCIYGGAEGNVLRPAVGYSVAGNLIVRPKFEADSPTAPITPNSACAAFAPR